MDEQILNTVSKKYKITLNENEQYKKLKVMGMTFYTNSYYIDGIGHFGIMKSSGMLGLMKMDTIVINPFEVDAPMLSIDCIKVGSKKQLILELYDTTISSKFHNTELINISDKYKNIADIPQKPHWYDNLHVNPCLYKICPKNNNSLNDQLMEEFLNAYLDSLKCYEKVDNKEKMNKAAIYSNGLVEHGGPATDPFVKKYGKEFTRQFFKEVLFGC